MRKFLLSCVIATTIFSSHGHAQTERATLMLGGSASFQATDGSTLFVFNPNLGVFVRDNLAVGLSVNLIASDGESVWALGPFARYYFTKNLKGKPFAQAALVIGGASGSDVSLGGGLSGGYAFFLNQSIALEAAATYLRVDDSGLFTIGAGFQIHFRKSK